MSKRIARALTSVAVGRRTRAHLRLSRSASVVAPFFVIALAAACSSGNAEKVGSSGAKIQSSEAQYFNATTYEVQIKEIDINSATPADGTGPYVYWAALGLNVFHAGETTPTTTYAGCQLNAGNPLKTCSSASGLSTHDPTTPGIAGLAVQASATMLNQGDSLQVGIVLDNIEGGSGADAGNSTAQWASTGLNILGNASQSAGALIALDSATVAADGVTGGWYSAIGAALAVVGSALGAPPTSSQGPALCTGGLISAPTPAFSSTTANRLTCFPGPIPCGVPNPPLDTTYDTFTAIQLAELTANGASTFTIPVSVTWPDSLVGDQAGACNSSHAIQITISRDINSGLAPSPKSADFAVARRTDELDVFRPYPHVSTTTQYGGFDQNKWSAEEGWTYQQLGLNEQSASVPPSTAYTAISRSPDHIDLFWADQYGDLNTAAWSDTAPSWALVARPPVQAALPPNAKITAVSRTPSSLDIFYVDASGAIQWFSWSSQGWALMPSPAPSGSATPGGGIAAVARTWENMDLFWIGADGALHTAYFYSGSSASFQLQTTPISPTGLAAPGANVAATARTSDNLDVFFVGKSGAVESSSWYWPQPAAGWVAAFPISGSAHCDSTSAISAVSRLPNSLDVVCVGSNALHEFSWQPTTGEIGGTGGYSVVQSSASDWVSPAIPVPAPVVDPTRVSIVARAAGNLDMFFDDTSGTLHTLAWAGGVESSGPTGGSGFAAPPIALYAPPPLVRYSEPVASHVAASRNAAGAVLTEYSLQALFVGTDGVLYSDSAQAIAQGTWTRTPVTSVPTGANLAIDANSFDLNVVYADADGVVRALLGNPDWDSQNPKSTYTPNWTTAPMALSVGNVMPPGGGTAIGEQGSQLDAFFVDYTGTLQVAWGTSAADSWVPPQPISAAGYAPPGALLATGTQAGTQLDLFVIGSNQELGGYHVANSGGWAPFSIQGGFPAGGAIATIAQGSNQLDLLAIDKNGSLWLFWVDGLGAWSSAQLSSGDAIAGSRVAVASLNGLTYALYVNKVGELVVWDVATGAWTGPNQIASGFAPGAPVAVAVQDQQLDAFVPGADGTMKVLWGTGSLDWAGPASLP